MQREVSVLCLGELLVDRFGDAEHPGGAPANVAHNIAALGETAALVSRMGNDAAGRRMAAWLADGGVRSDLLQCDGLHATGSVRVWPGPRYDIAAPAAWDLIELEDKARQSAVSARVIVFGTLAQRHPASRRTIRKLVETARAHGADALCDLNLRAPFHDEESVLWSLRHCDVLKLNREELETVSLLLHAQGETNDLFVGLLREFGIARGVLTDGAKGAWIFEEDELIHQPVHPVSRLVDSVGAGDAFTAIIALAVSRRLSLRRASASASALAAFVVSQAGATPEIPAELVAQISAMLEA